MQKVINRIKTKPGYKFLAIVAFLSLCVYALQATAPTVYVNADGYAYKVNDKTLDMPTKNAELFREAGTVIYDK